jgi:hypothetical protein
VPPDGFDIWLGGGSVEGKDDLAAATALIVPAPDDLLEAFPVSTDINRVANDNPGLIEAVTVSEPAPKPKRVKQAKPAKPKPEKLKKDDGQGALF